MLLGMVGLWWLKLKAADFNLQGVVHLYWICVPAFLVRLTEISSDLEAPGSRPDLVSLGQGHRGRSHCTCCGYNVPGWL